MPAPHSLDLRLKAVAAFDKGERKSDICRFFGISRNTLDLWLKRREKIGSVAPKTDYRRGPQPKINDLDAFRAFAEEYGHLTQKEMAEKWPESISDASAAIYDIRFQLMVLRDSYACITPGRIQATFLSE